MSSQSRRAVTSAIGLRRMTLTNRVLAAVAGAVALAGWLVFEQDTDEGLGVLLFGGAFLALGLLAPLLGSLTSPAGVAAWAVGVSTAKRSQPPPKELPVLGGRVVWLLPLALLPLMLLALPLAFATAPGDWSILLVLAGFVVLLAPGCMLCGLLLWMLVGMPLLLFSEAVVHLAQRRATIQDGLACLVGALLILVLLFAVALTLALNDRAGGRSGRLLALLALLGLDDQDVVDVGLLWLARLAALLIVAVLVGFVLLARRLQRRAA